MTTPEGQEETPTKIPWLREGEEDSREELLQGRPALIVSRRYDTVDREHSRRHAQEARS